MSILIIGGTHGGEPSGVELVSYLEAHLIDSVKTLLAHPQAVAKGVRFIETDLNRSANIFPTHSLEEHLAAELQPIIATHDLVLDFHNTTATNTTCLIVSNAPTDLDMQISCAFEIANIAIIPSSHNLISYSKHGIGVEIARDDLEKYTTEFLAKSIQNIVQKRVIQNQKIDIFELVSTIEFKYINRSILLKNFEPLSTEQSKQLDIKIPNLYPIFFGEVEYKSMLCMLVKKIEIDF